MRVWQKPFPGNPTLSGSEGNLISVSISVDPRYLESLLEALAHVSFPINPQIYHDAAVVYIYADQHQETEAATLVEFPAYVGQLEEVTSALRSFGFDPANVQVAGMLEDIHSGFPPEPVPPGAPYVSRHRIRQRTTSVH